MTASISPEDQRTPADQRIVDELLAESARLAGSTDAPDARLRAALLDLRTLAHTPAPQPSAVLAAYLSGAVVSLNARRNAKRAVIVGLSVITAIGLGVGSAAAVSPDFRDSADETLTGIIETITGTSADAETPTTPDSTDAGHPDKLSPHATGAPGKPGKPAEPGTPDGGVKGNSGDPHGNSGPQTSTSTDKTSHGKDVGRSRNGNR